MLLSVRDVIRVSHIALERHRRDAGIGQDLCRPRRRGQARDLVPLSLGQVADRGQCRGLAGAGHTVQADRLIAASQDLMDRGPLAFIQVRMIASQALGGVHGAEGLVSALTDLHPSDRIALELEHLRGGERTAWLVTRLGHAHEVAGLEPGLKCHASLLQRDVPHATHERISQ